jgi:HPt (histidine-containing phosphotransfer) domain-containing protein
MNILTIPVLPVNLERLNRLLKGNFPLQQKLLYMFLKQAEIRVQSLRQGIINRDFISIKQQAHALRGSSATAAILMIPEIAEELEDLAEAENLEGAMELVEKLEQCLIRVRLFVQEEILSESTI